MVEKRAIVLVMLVTLVWASITSGFAAYYFLEQSRCQKGFYDEQHLLADLVRNYDASVAKQDSLLRDYNALLEQYYQFFGDNVSPFVVRYRGLLSNLGSNYTATLDGFPKLNETYSDLLNRAVNEQSVTRDEFDSLLNDFYGLLSGLVSKELESSLDRISVMNVDLGIDYGNGTMHWYNVSVSRGATLFDLTRNLTMIDYSYYSAMQPGHALVNSINGVAPSDGKYWFWYYWDDTKNVWIAGQIGCDAWVLKGSGVYKWVYTAWSP